MIWKLICWYLSDILFDIYLSWWTIHSSVAKSCPTLCNPMDCRCQAPVSSNISQILMSIELVMLSKHLILWHTLLLLSSIFPNIRVFSTALHMKWPKYFGTLASASVLPTRGWFPLGLTGLISLQSKGLSRIFSSITMFKNMSSSALSLLYGSTVTIIHDYWKNHSFDYMGLCQVNR